MRKAQDCVAWRAWHWDLIWSINVVVSASYESCPKVYALDGTFTVT